MTVIGPSQHSLFFNGVSDAVICPQALFDESGITPLIGSTKGRSSMGVTRDGLRPQSDRVNAGRVLGNFTVEAWVRPDAGGTVAIKEGLFELHIGSIDDPAPAVFIVHYTNTQGVGSTLRASTGEAVVGGSGYTGVIYPRTAASFLVNNSSLNDGTRELIHVAGVFTGEEAMLFVNGELVAAERLNGLATLTFNDNDLFIGGRGGEYRGYIDSLHWKRGMNTSGLTPTRFIPTTDTIGLWRFEEPVEIDDGIYYITSNATAGDTTLTVGTTQIQTLYQAISGLSDTFSGTYTLESLGNYRVADTAHSGGAQIINVAHCTHNLLINPTGTDVKTGYANNKAPERVRIKSLQSAGTITVESIHLDFGTSSDTGSRGILHGRTAYAETGTGLANDSTMVLIKADLLIDSGTGAPYQPPGLGTQTIDRTGQMVIDESSNGFHGFIFSRQMDIGSSSNYAISDGNWNVDNRFQVGHTGRHRYSHLVAHDFISHFPPSTDEVITRTMDGLADTCHVDFTAGAAGMKDIVPINSKVSINRRINLGPVHKVITSSTVSEVVRNGLASIDAYRDGIIAIGGSDFDIRPFLLKGHTSDGVSTSDFVYDLHLSPEDTSRIAILETGDTDMPYVEIHYSAIDLVGTTMGVSNPCLLVEKTVPDGGVSISGTRVAARIASAMSGGATLYAPGGIIEFNGSDLGENSIAFDAHKLVGDNTGGTHIEYTLDKSKLPSNYTPQSTGDDANSPPLSISSALENTSHPSQYHQLVIRPSSYIEDAARKSSAVDSYKRTPIVTGTNIGTANQSTRLFETFDVIDNSIIENRYQIIVQPSNRLRTMQLTNISQTATNIDDPNFISLEYVMSAGRVERIDVTQTDVGGVVRMTVRGLMSDIASVRSDYTGDGSPDSHIVKEITPGAPVVTVTLGGPGQGAVNTKPTFDPSPLSRLGWSTRTNCSTLISGVDVSSSPRTLTVSPLNNLSTGMSSWGTYCFPRRGRVYLSSGASAEYNDKSGTQFIFSASSSLLGTGRFVNANGTEEDTFAAWVTTNGVGIGDELLLDSDFSSKSICFDGTTVNDRLFQSIRSVTHDYQLGTQYASTRALVEIPLFKEQFFANPERGIFPGPDNSMRLVLDATMTAHTWAPNPVGRRCPAYVPADRELMSAYHKQWVGDEPRQALRALEYDSTNRTIKVSQEGELMLPDSDTSAEGAGPVREYQNCLRPRRIFLSNGEWALIEKIDRTNNLLHLADTGTLVNAVSSNFFEQFKPGALLTLAQGFPNSGILPISDDGFSPETAANEFRRPFYHDRGNVQTQGGNIDYGLKQYVSAVEFQAGPRENPHLARIVSGGATVHLTAYTGSSNLYNFTGGENIPPGSLASNYAYEAMGENGRLYQVTYDSDALTLAVIPHPVFDSGAPALTSTTGFDLTLKSVAVSTTGVYPQRIEGGAVNRTWNYPYCPGGLRYGDTVWMNMHYTNPHAMEGLFAKSRGVLNAFEVWNGFNGGLKELGIEPRDTVALENFLIGDSCIETTKNFIQHVNKTVELNWTELGLTTTAPVVAYLDPYQSTEQHARVLLYDVAHDREFIALHDLHMQVQSSPRAATVNGLDVAAGFKTQDKSTDPSLYGGALSTASGTYTGTHDAGAGVVSIITDVSKSHFIESAYSHPSWWNLDAPNNNIYTGRNDLANRGTPHTIQTNDDVTSPCPVPGSADRTENSVCCPAEAVTRHAENLDKAESALVTSGNSLRYRFNSTFFDTPNGTRAIPAFLCLKGIRSSALDLSTHTESRLQNLPQWSEMDFTRRLTVDLGEIGIKVGNTDIEAAVREVVRSINQAAAKQGKSASGRPADQFPGEGERLEVTRRAVNTMPDATSTSNITDPTSAHHRADFAIAGSTHDPAPFWDDTAFTSFNRGSHMGYLRAHIGRVVTDLDGNEGYTVVIHSTVPGATGRNFCTWLDNARGQTPYRPKFLIGHGGRFRNHWCQPDEMMNQNMHPAPMPINRDGRPFAPITTLQENLSPEETAEELRNKSHLGYDDIFNNNISASVTPVAGASGVTGSSGSAVITVAGTSSSNTFHFAPQGILTFSHGGVDYAATYSGKTYSTFTGVTDIIANFVSTLNSNIQAVSQSSASSTYALNPNATLPTGTSSNTQNSESFESQGKANTVIEGLRTGTPARARINFGGIVAAGIPGWAPDAGKWGFGPTGTDNSRFGKIYGANDGSSTYSLYVPDADQKTESVGSDPIYGIQFVDHNGNQHGIRYIYREEGKEFATDNTQLPPSIESETIIRFNDVDVTAGGFTLGQNMWGKGDPSGHIKAADVGTEQTWRGNLWNGTPAPEAAYAVTLSAVPSAGDTILTLSTTSGHGYRDDGIWHDIPSDTDVDVLGYLGFPDSGLLWVCANNNSTSNDNPGYVLHYTSRTRADRGGTHQFYGITGPDMAGIFQGVGPTAWNNAKSPNLISPMLNYTTIVTDELMAAVTEAAMSSVDPNIPTNFDCSEIRAPDGRTYAAWLGDAAKTAITITKFSKSNTVQPLKDLFEVNREADWGLYVGSVESAAAIQSKSSVTVGNLHLGGLSRSEINASSRRIDVGYLPRTVLHITTRYVGTNANTATPVLVDSNNNVVSTTTWRQNLRGDRFTRYAGDHITPAVDGATAAVWGTSGKSFTAKTGSSPNRLWTLQLEAQVPATLTTLPGESLFLFAPLGRYSAYEKRIGGTGSEFTNAEDLSFSPSYTIWQDDKHFAKVEGVSKFNITGTTHTHYFVYHDGDAHPDFHKQLPDHAGAFGGLATATRIHLHRYGKTEEAILFDGVRLGGSKYSEPFLYFRGAEDGPDHSVPLYFGGGFSGLVMDVNDGTTNDYSSFYSHPYASGPTGCAGLQNVGDSMGSYAVLDAAAMLAMFPGTALLNQHKGESTPPFANQDAILSPDQKRSGGFTVPTGGTYGSTTVTAPTPLVLRFAHPYARYEDATKSAAYVVFGPGQSVPKHWQGEVADIADSVEPAVKWNVSSKPYLPHRAATSKVNITTASGAYLPNEISNRDAALGGADAFLPPAASFQANNIYPYHTLLNWEPTHGAPNSDFKQSDARETFTTGGHFGIGRPASAPLASVKQAHPYNAYEMSGSVLLEFAIHASYGIAKMLFHMDGGYAPGGNWFDNAVRKNPPHPVGSATIAPQQTTTDAIGHTITLGTNASMFRVGSTMLSEYDDDLNSTVPDDVFAIDATRVQNSEELATVISAAINTWPGRSALKAIGGTFLPSFQEAQRQDRYGWVKVGSMGSYTRATSPHSFARIDVAQAASETMPDGLPGYGWLRMVRTSGSTDPITLYGTYMGIGHASTGDPLVITLGENFASRDFGLEDPTVAGTSARLEASLTSGDDDYDIYIWSKTGNLRWSNGAHAQLRSDSQYTTLTSSTGVKGTIYDHLAATQVHFSGFVDAVDRTRPTGAVGWHGERYSYLNSLKVGKTTSGYGVAAGLGAWHPFLGFNPYGAMTQCHSLNQTTYGVTRGSVTVEDEEEEIHERPVYLYSQYDEACPTGIHPRHFIVVTHESELPLVAKADREGIVCAGDMLNLRWASSGGKAGTVKAAHAERHNNDRYVAWADGGPHIDAQIVSDTAPPASGATNPTHWHSAVTAASQLLPAETCTYLTGDMFFDKTMNPGVAYYPDDTLNNRTLKTECKADISPTAASSTPFAYWTSKTPAVNFLSQHIVWKRMSGGNLCLPAPNARGLGAIPWVWRKVDTTGDGSTDTVKKFGETIYGNVRFSFETTNSAMFPVIQAQELAHPQLAERKPVEIRDVLDIPNEESQFKDIVVIDDTGQEHYIQGGSPFGTIVRDFKTITNRESGGLAPSLANSGEPPNMEIQLPDHDTIPGNILVRSGFDRVQSYQHETMGSGGVQRPDQPDSDVLSNFNSINQFPSVSPTWEDEGWERIDSRPDKFPDTRSGGFTDSTNKSPLQTSYEQNDRALFFHVTRVGHTYSEREPIGYVSNILTYNALTVSSINKTTGIITANATIQSDIWRAETLADGRAFLVVDGKIASYTSVSGSEFRGAVFETDFPDTSTSSIKPSFYIPSGSTRHFAARRLRDHCEVSGESPDAPLINWAAVNTGGGDIVTPMSRIRAVDLTPMPLPRMGHHYVTPTMMMMPGHMAHPLYQRLYSAHQACSSAVTKSLESVLGYDQIGAFTEGTSDRDVSPLSLVYFSSTTNNFPPSDIHGDAFTLMFETKVRYDGYGIADSTATTNSAGGHRIKLEAGTNYSTHWNFPDPLEVGAYQVVIQPNLFAQQFMGNSKNPNFGSTSRPAVGTDYPILTDQQVATVVALQWNGLSYDLILAEATMADVRGCEIYMNEIMLDFDPASGQQFANIPTLGLFNPLGVNESSSPALSRRSLPYRPNMFRGSTPGYTLTVPWWAPAIKSSTVWTSNPWKRLEHYQPDDYYRLCRSNYGAVASQIIMAGYPTHYLDYYTDTYTSLAPLCTVKRKTNEVTPETSADGTIQVTNTDLFPLVGRDYYNFKLIVKDDDGIEHQATYGHRGYSSGASTQNTTTFHNVSGSTAFWALLTEGREIRLSGAHGSLMAGEHYTKSDRSITTRNLPQMLNGSRDTNSLHMGDAFLCLWHYNLGRPMTWFSDTRTNASDAATDAQPYNHLPEHFETIHYHEFTYAISDGPFDFRMKFWGTNTAVAASATITVSNTDVANVGEGDTIQLISTDGQTVTLTLGSQSATTTSATSSGTTLIAKTLASGSYATPALHATAQAVEIRTAINHHTAFTATNSSNVTTVTQAKAGREGNTTVTITELGATGFSNTNFTNGVGLDIIAPDDFESGFPPQARNDTESSPKKYHFGSYWPGGSRFGAQASRLDMWGYAADGWGRRWDDRSIIQDAAGAAASATITVSNTDVANVGENDTIQLISTYGTVVTLTLGSQTATTTAAITSGTSLIAKTLASGSYATPALHATAQAVEIRTAINYHTEFTATNSSNVVTVNQANAGVDGNTTITIAELGATGLSRTNFSSGSGHTGISLTSADSTGITDTVDSLSTKRHAGFGYRFAVRQPHNRPRWSLRATQALYDPYANTHAGYHAGPFVQRDQQTQSTFTETNSAAVTTTATADDAYVGILERLTAASALLGSDMKEQQTRYSHGRRMTRPYGCAVRNVVNESSIIRSQPGDFIASIAASGVGEQRRNLAVAIAHYMVDWWGNTTGEEIRRFPARGFGLRPAWDPEDAYRSTDRTATTVSFIDAKTNHSLGHARADFDTFDPSTTKRVGDRGDGRGVRWPTAFNEDKLQAVSIPIRPTGMVLSHYTSEPPFTPGYIRARNDTLNDDEIPYGISRRLDIHSTEGLMKPEAMVGDNIEKIATGLLPANETQHEFVSRSGPRIGLDTLTQGAVNNQFARNYAILGTEAYSLHTDRGIGKRYIVAGGIKTDTRAVSDFDLTQLNFSSFKQVMRLNHTHGLPPLGGSFILDLLNYVSPVNDKGWGRSSPTSSNRTTNPYQTNVNDSISGQTNTTDKLIRFLLRPVRVLDHRHVEVFRDKDHALAGTAAGRYGLFTLSAPNARAAKGYYVKTANPAFATPPYAPSYLFDETGAFQAPVSYGPNIPGTESSTFTGDINQTVARLYSSENTLQHFRSDAGRRQSVKVEEDTLTRKNYSIQPRFSQSLSPGASFNTSTHTGESDHTDNELTP